MPLYDVFHPPLSDILGWESVHHHWSVVIAADLNRRLPRRFLATASAHIGPYVSSDVVERELLARPGGPAANGATGGGTAVAAATDVYAPPAAAHTVPAAFPSEYEIEVRDTHHASRVLAVVELVSPGNKKEENERVKFAAKCLSLLGKGVGVVVVDVVTDRLWNLHNEMVRLAGHAPASEMPGDPPLYAAAYRPVRRNSEDVIDLWHWPLAVGGPLPTVPLALMGFGCVALDLEASYTETCAQLHIP